MAQSPTRHNLNSASSGKTITPGTAFNACIAVNAAGAGAGTVTWLDGSTTSYYFTVGINPIQITNVASGGLAASGLIALYND